MKAKCELRFDERCSVYYIVDSFSGSIIVQEIKLESASHVLDALNAYDKDTPRNVI